MMKAIGKRTISVFYPSLHQAWCCLILVLIPVLIHLPTASCQDASPLTFRFADGSELRGHLSAANSEQSIAIKSDLFTDAGEIPLRHLLEATTLSEASDVSEENRRPDTSERFTDEQFAARLIDDSQIVGDVVSWEGDRIQIASPTLGTVSIATDQLFSLRRIDDVPARVASLVSLPHRFQRPRTWRSDNGEVIADQPGAMVGRLDLPDRFRLLVEIQCDGNSNVQITLGDRAEAGVGQGSRVRRGGSVSRSPEEQLVTDVEWYGDSLSLVRANASVADVAVVPWQDTRTLKIELRIDQPAGRLVALVKGEEVARAELTDSVPSIRRQLTLTNRGDSIRLRRLEVFQWDGQSDLPAEIATAATTLTDGTTIDHVIAAGEINLERVRSIGFATPLSPSPGCEFTLDDRTRVRGIVTVNQDFDNGEKTIQVRSATGQTYRVDPQSVRQVIGLGTSQPSSNASRLRNRDQRLFGTPVRSGSDTAFVAWSSPMLAEPLGVAANSLTRIALPMTNPSGTFQPSLRLHDGDRMQGETVAVEASSVAFQGKYCAACSIEESAIRAIELQSITDLDPAALRYALSLPRMKKSTPPTHLLIAPNGDLLRGRLESLGRAAATIEVRQIQRTIPRDAIGQIIRLDAPVTDATKPRFERDFESLIDAVIVTGDQSRLSLRNVSFDGVTLTGDHDSFGRCTTPIEQVTELWLGPQPSDASQSWKLIDVKTPRSYDEPEPSPSE
ncbi:hypothetical protein U8335_05430 [Roseiconus lacunae]|uniref:hypothetical protein n=1 Tax=Roseiconus lacunae TaxID=2605694 RepID=UPI00308837B0|nr:hypothetical protein U8335_05430 [Stieleria sp. HD01]